jgi:hypothetical protein
VEWLLPKINTRYGKGYPKNARGTTPFLDRNMELNDVVVDDWRARELGDEPIYCSALETPEDVECFGSDEEIDDNARIARRLRYEEQGLRYLRGQPPLLMSTTLRGPFDRSSGWHNPWLRNGQPKRRNRPETKQQLTSKPGPLADPPLRNEVQRCPDIENPTPTSEDSMQCHLPGPDITSEFQHGMGRCVDTEKRARIQQWANSVQSKSTGNSMAPWLFDKVTDVSASNGEKRSAGKEWLTTRPSKRRRCLDTQIACLSSPTPAPCPEPSETLRIASMPVPLSQEVLSNTTSRPLSCGFEATTSRSGGNQKAATNLRKPFSRVTKRVNVRAGSIVKANVGQSSSSRPLPKPVDSADNDHDHDEQATSLSSLSISQVGFGTSSLPEVEVPSAMRNCAREETEVSACETHRNESESEGDVAHASFERRSDNSFHYKAAHIKRDVPACKVITVIPAEPRSQLTQTGTPESGRHGDAVVFDGSPLAISRSVQGLENGNATNPLFIGSSQDQASTRSSRCRDGDQGQSRDEQMPTGQRTLPAQLSKRLDQSTVRELGPRQHIITGAAADSVDKAGFSRNLPGQILPSLEEVQHQAVAGTIHTPAETPSPSPAEVPEFNPFIIPAIAFASPLKLSSSISAFQLEPQHGARSVSPEKVLEANVRSNMIDSATNREGDTLSYASLEPEGGIILAPRFVSGDGLSSDVMVVGSHLDKPILKAEYAIARYPMTIDGDSVAREYSASKTANAAEDYSQRTSSVAAVAQTVETKDPHKCTGPTMGMLDTNLVDVHLNNGLGQKETMKDSTMTENSTQTQSKTVDVISSSSQLPVNIENSLTTLLLKVEPMDDVEEITDPTEMPTSSEHPQEPELDECHIKSEPVENVAPLSCSGQVALPSSPLVEPTHSVLRPSQQSPWADTAANLAAMETPKPSKVNSTTPSSPSNRASQALEEIQSPWAEVNLPSPCAPPDSFVTDHCEDGGLQHATTDSIQVTEPAVDVPVFHSPYTTLLAQKAATPDPDLSIKSFAQFNSPLRKRRSTGIRCPQLSGDRLPSTQVLVDAAQTNPWERTQSGSSKHFPARRVTFAPLPGEKEGVVSENRSGSLRPGSPPPQSSIDLGDEDMDVHFQRHFEVMKQRSGGAPRFRLARPLLPSSSQQFPVSPRVDAMAEAFREADLRRVHGGDISVIYGADTLPQTSLFHDVEGEHQLGSISQPLSRGEDVSQGFDDVADVLQNLDDFLNPRWDIENAENTISKTVGNENQTGGHSIGSVFTCSSIWGVVQENGERNGVGSFGGLDMIPI